MGDIDFNSPMNGTNVRMFGCQQQDPDAMINSPEKEKFKQGEAS